MFTTTSIAFLFAGTEATVQRLSTMFLYFMNCLELDLLLFFVEYY